MMLMRLDAFAAIVAVLCGYRATEGKASQPTSSDRWSHQSSHLLVGRTDDPVGGGYLRPIKSMRRGQ